jgi:hypothetical protein
MEPMHRAISVPTDAPIEAIMPVVGDLATYPSWLDLVHTADRVEREDGTYLITLRAKVGPFARSKKLRMVRTELTDNSARFERAETDGREHSNWVMSIEATPAATGGSDLEIALAYDGDLWSGPLQLILDAQANKAGRKLDAFVLAAPGSV